MAINKINNGDSGSVVRGILNAVIDAVNSFLTSLLGVSNRVQNIESNLTKYTISQEDRDKIDNAVTSLQLTAGLEGKVDAKAGSRLITDIEARKLATAVNGETLQESLKGYVKIVMKDIAVVSKEYKGVFLRARHEGEVVEEENDVKINLADLIGEIKANNINTSIELLLGEQDGKHDTFSTAKEFVEGTTSVWVSGRKFFKGRQYEELSNRSIKFLSYLPEPSDTLYIEAIWK